MQDLEHNEPPRVSSNGSSNAVDSGAIVDALRRWGLVVLAAIVIAFSVQFFVARPYVIPSASMMPTLGDGDRVMVNRLSYTVGDLQRGQVIVFDTPPNQESDADVFIKRVIGLPGETVIMRDGAVYIDGLLMVEPYLAASTGTRQGPRRIPGCANAEPAFSSCTVPDGHVFVLGDNRGASDDSRVFGPVPIDTIVGRAALRVWPLSEIAQL